MKKVLITGATGGLGSKVVEFLQQNNGIQTIILARNPEHEQAKAFAAQGLEIRQGDYNVPASLVQAFHDIDILYFVSGSDLTSRMSQHEKVVAAAKTTQVGHIIYTSAGRKNEAETAPLSPVISTHVKTEALIKATGIPYTILQHNLYSEVIAMFLGSKEQLLGSKTVFLPTGAGKVAFVTRDDLAEAGARIIEGADQHINQVYTLNGSEEISFAQIAMYLSTVLGENIAYVSPSIPEFEKTLSSFQIPAEIIGMITMFSLGIADGEFEGSGHDLEQILGRKSTSVEAFIGNVYGAAVTAE